MPHALSMPYSGFQALILCGPGSSFPTFTSNPDENPKALIPIANRPMVWYPIDFCYRMGISDITLIAPPSSAPAIEAALNTNPHLTGLPLPKPNLLAPRDLDQNTGTAQIFRLSEVQSVIKGDFLVLPCDLLCEIGGEAFLEAWMVKQAGFGGATGLVGEIPGPKVTAGGEKCGRRGGMGVWYETNGEIVIKGEETDFIATAPVEPGATIPPKTSLLPQISNLVYSMPTDTLNDITEAKKSFMIRHALIRNHPRLRMLSSHRDAHVYIFPRWVLDMINRNENMDSLGEDVVGFWAKAGWQDGLGAKLGLHDIFNEHQSTRGHDNLLDNNTEYDNIDIANLSTTYSATPQQYCATEDTRSKKSELVVPPILAYIHPAPKPGVLAPIIRRVDTAPLLLAMSLQLAKLEAIEVVGREAASPFAQQSKIASPEGIASKTTVTRPDCLIAENVRIEEKCSVKECVIGVNCTIKSGAKLQRCVLMDGVVVGKGCKLTGCILGKRSEIGDESILQDCEVQENLLVEPKTEDKNNKLMSSEGMEATEEEMEESFAQDEVPLEDHGGGMGLGSAVK